MSISHSHVAARLWADRFTRRLPQFGIRLVPAMRPDGSELYVTLRDQGKIVAVNRASLAVTRVFVTDGEPARVAFDPAGTTAVVANLSGWVDFLP